MCGANYQHSPWPKGHILQLANHLWLQTGRCSFSDQLGHVSESLHLWRYLCRLLLATVTAFIPLLREDLLNSLGYVSPFILCVYLYYRSLKNKTDLFQLRASITRAFANDKYSFPLFQIKYLSSRKEYPDVCEAYCYKSVLYSQCPVHH